MRSLFIVAALLPALAFAQGDSSTQLLSRLHRDAATHSELGDLTQLNGTSRQVTAFAATVASDYLRLDQAVVEYAAANGVTFVPLEEDPNAAKLRGLAGSELDHAFLVWISQGSTALTRQLESLRGQGDAPFKRVVNRALATVNGHRRLADQLLREVPQT
ncbi:MAG: DUF4142 domain-containing protein [Archangiaceae bacterium]|nr:DUF4142 domain-containing protein [Archangiaceae bacterium]